MVEISCIMSKKLHGSWDWGKSVNELRIELAKAGKNVYGSS